MARLRMEEYSRRVRRVLIVTLVLNLLVAVAKFAAGLIADSLSVISDAFHSSGDSLNNLVGLAVLRVASAPPDADHPYGHHKFETLAAFSIAGFLLVTAFELSVGAVKNILGWSTRTVELTLLTFAVMGGTLIVNLFVWLYEKRRAAELNSSFLLADSRHTLSDIFVTSSVLAGLALLQLGVANLDAYLALAVAGMIAHAAYGIFSATIPVLVDSAPLSEEHIARIVRETPGVESVHDIRSRGVPGRIFVTMHLVVGPTDTVEAHAVTEAVEKRLEETIGPCHVTIHVEPGASY